MRLKWSLTKEPIGPPCRHTAPSSTPIKMKRMGTSYRNTTCKARSLTRNVLLRVVFFLFPTLGLLLPFQLKAQIDADAVTIMGRNALSVDDYLTAIRYFNEAIDAKPFLSRPYYYRAYAKFTLEDYKGAAEDLDKSISLNPFITEVYQLRGLCRIHLEDFAGATDDYTKVIAESPNDQPTRYNRALCQLQLKHYANADADLDYLISHWPNFYRSYMVKAQSQFEQKDTIEGLKWIDRLLSINPKEEQAWSFKGRYALNKGNYQLADSCLTKAIGLQPKNFENYVARAQARHALDQFGLAIADYDATISLVPDHFVAHYNRGLLRSFVGDLNRAITDFDFVINKEPDNILAIYNRAQLRQQVGNYKGAILDYTTLLRSYPRFMYGYLARAECRRKVGDIRGAQADETVVAKQNLDVAYAKNKPRPSIRKVRLRSENALEQYQQLVEEDPDTARNVFGTLLGKVQNEKVSSELLPMYALAFRPKYTRGYHSIVFLPEVERLKSLNTESRQICFTAETDNASSVAQQAADERQFERMSEHLQIAQRHLVASALSAARYNYSSALNEVQAAAKADSTSIVALLQGAFILSRSAASGATQAEEQRAQLKLALSLTDKALRLSPHHAVAAYNRGCLLAQMGDIDGALTSFSEAITTDKRMAEAYYNRGILLQRKGETLQATSDFSMAGQLGLYQAYAMLKNFRNQ